MSEKKNVIIVGAGIYGMSTALWMLEDGGYDVTILDKCGVLPAPDAASCDLNKIIRAGDYADPHLAKMGIEAVEMWRKPEWEGTYHESGVICLSHSSMADGLKFVECAYTNCKTYGINAKKVNGTAEIKPFFPDVETGTFGDRQGYKNPVGGWAEAGRANDVGIKRVRQLGGTVRSGCEVQGLIRDGKKVLGVTLQTGEEVKGDLVVVCAGAWTPGLFAMPEFDARLPDVIATGQSLATIQLTEDEVKRYSKCPVMINLDNGWYIFPPNPQGLIKMAIHGAGYTNPCGEKKVSIPRTTLTPGGEAGMIPKVMLVALRKGLAEVYPELADREFISTRLCWYCDTVTGDWLIDYHPDFENLVVATGDSGHAFKYAPIIGREILRIIQRKPSPEFLGRWSFDGKGDKGADVRLGVRTVLKEDELATAEDLKLVGKECNLVEQVKTLKVAA